MVGERARGGEEGSVLDKVFNGWVYKIKALRKEDVSPLPSLKRREHTTVQNAVRCLKWKQGLIHSWKGNVHSNTIHEDEEHKTMIATLRTMSWSLSRRPLSETHSLKGYKGSRYDNTLSNTLEGYGNHCHDMFSIGCFCVVDGFGGEWSRVVVRVVQRIVTGIFSLGSQSFLPFRYTFFSTDHLERFWTLLCVGGGINPIHLGSTGWWVININIRKP